MRRRCTRRVARIANALIQGMGTSRRRGAVSGPVVRLAKFRGDRQSVRLDLQYRNPSGRSILDVMYAKALYTGDSARDAHSSDRQRVVPTMLGELKPLEASGERAA